MPLILIIPLVIIFLSTLSVVLFGLWWKRKQKQKDLAYLKGIEADASFNFMDVKTETKTQLAESLSTLENQNIKSIYLVHGTFVGPDPFDIYSFLEANYPQVKNKFYKILKEKLQKGQDLISQDNGNFTDKHINMIENHGNIRTFNFSWSSGNHHYARVKGSLKLLEHLCKYHEEGDRILVLGHSHAGAVFALLNNQLEHPEFRKLLDRIITNQNLHIQNYKKLIKKAKTFKFHFVTMGSPKRYDWIERKNTKLLHLINHRGEYPLGGKISGFINTKSGDYIQQWGVIGSDIISPILEENLINEELNKFLGEGQNFEILKTQIAKRLRLHNIGHHYLIDYKDSSSIPNFIPTVFGHGVYTKMKYLNFHFKVITDFFFHP